MKTATVFCCIICIIVSIFMPAALHAEKQLVKSIPLKGGLPPGVLAVTSPGSTGPRLVPYWDAALTERTACFGPSDTVTVYLVLENLSGPIDQVRYAIHAAASYQIQYLSETVEAGVATGDLTNGITLDFPSPVDASGQLLLQTVTYDVTDICNPGCSTEESYGINVYAHPDDGGTQIAVATVSGIGEVIVFTHTARTCDDDGLVELEIVSFTSPDTAMSYDDITSEFSLTVRNSSPDSMINNYNVVIKLVDDTNTIYGSTVTSVIGLEPLGPGASASVPFDGLTIPSGRHTGPQYFLTQIDYNQIVHETDESDNHLWHPVEIIKNPDVDTIYFYAEDFQEGPNGWSAININALTLVSHWSQTTYNDGVDREFLWCGTDDPAYATPPGYGNGWQEGVYKQFSLPAGFAALSCMLQYDSEPDYDYTRIQISANGTDYTDLVALSGSSGGFSQHDFDISTYAGQTVTIRFLFESDGGYSDEDGSYPSEGAMRIDWVAVTGFATDDFISGFDGWEVFLPGAPGGEFRLVFDPKCEMTYPCDFNSSTGESQVFCNAWVAYDPVTEVFPSSPEINTNLAIESPIIDLPADVIDIVLRYDMYANLPYGCNVFFQWEVAWDTDWLWTGDNMNHYALGGWITTGGSLVQYMPIGATQMKVRLVAREYNYGAQTQPHTTSPMFDNIRIYAISTSGGGLDMSSFPRNCIVADEDWDGVGDLTDICPAEDSAPFDRDGDGCLDEAIGSRHIEYYPFTTFEYRIHSEGSPHIGDGSDMTAVQNGFDAWNAVGGTDITTVYAGTVADPRAKAFDGVNMVTFTDPEFNFPMGVLAVGLSTSFVDPARHQEYHVRPGQIIDADIIFNPNMAFGTPTAGEGTDIQSVATHEAGHLFGISHSAVQTSTMFFVLPPGTEASTLEAEDRAAFRKAYADETVMASASRLKGTVTDGETGEPVPGAIVYAIDAVAGDTLGSGYTMTDGTFDFFSLPDGDYYVAIHPLNGSSRIGYLQAANVNQYVRDIYVDLFVPEYYDVAESNFDDETAMTAVSVTSGSTTNIALVTNIDEEGPVVVETSPVPGEGGVKIDASILISFSEPIDLATLQGNFSLRDTLSGEAIGGNVASFDDDSTLAFIPARNLDFEKIYKLELGTGLSDKFGNGLASPYIVFFTTEVKPDVGITSIMPRKGIESAIVVVSGFGFEAAVAGNTVHFNGADATITDASATRLVVEVPEGAITGNVTVDNLVEGKSSNALSFTILSAEEVARGYDAGQAPLGSHPRVLSVSPDGVLMFVGTEEGYSAVVVDPGSPDYLSTRAFPIEGGVDGIDVTPDGKRVYAVSSENEKLYRINGEIGAGGLDDLQILSEVAIGSEPNGIMIEPSGRKAYVITSDNTVDVYDVNPSSATFDMQIGMISEVGVSLRGCMTFDPSGDLLLIPTGEGKLAVCDTRGDTLVASIDVGLDPRDVTVDPTGTRAYVTDENGVATVVSLSMLEKVAEVATGGSLRGDAVTPAGSFLFSVNRELNFYDVIDLRQTSQTFRSVIANINLPVNPLDVELSPDGQYAFAICDHDMVLAVTAIGVGPTIHTISPAAGPEGAVVVIGGAGFGNDSTVVVSFNGITVDPDVRRDDVLIATVPPGNVTGPLMVIGGNPFRPDALSNEVYFEGLTATPGDNLRMAGQAGIAGLTGGVCATAVSGDMTLLEVDAGPDKALCAFDTDQSSDTYMQVLGTAAMPAGASIDEIVMTPAGDLAFVIDRGAGNTGELDHIPIIDVDRLSPGFLAGAGSIDVSMMTQGVSGACIDPVGRLLVVAEYGDPGGTAEATIHVFTYDSSGEGIFVPSGSFTVAGTTVEDPVFHPSGQYCYLPVADEAGPGIIVLDTDPESPGYLTTGAAMPLPGSPAGPVPASLSFTPDGQRCLVLTCDEGGTEQRDIVMIDTTDPAVPAVSHVEPLIGGTAGPSHIDVSPLGTHGVASIGGEGLTHFGIVTVEDSVLSIGGYAVTDPIPAGAYSADGSIYYCALPETDSFEALDFSDAQTLEIVSGNSQSGVAGTLLQAQLRVRVTTTSGAGLSGIPVRFTVYPDNGYFYSNDDTVRTVTTDDDGRAGVQWVLGPGTGTQNVSAWSPGLSGSPGVFTAEALTDPETLPLQFVEAVPYNSMTGTSATTAARLSFSRPVDPASVDTTVCYLLEDGALEPVPVLIGFSDGYRRVSITPREPLEPLTEYTLYVTAGILDGSGGPLQNPESSVFTTTDPPPLRLDAISPPSSIRGMNVVLSGQGFDRDAEDNTVYFNDKIAGVTDASDDHLTIVVPYDAVNGTNLVHVETAGQPSNLLSFRVLVPEVNSLDDDVIKKVGTGSTAKSVVVTPDGALAYAVSPASNSVVVIDIQASLPLASIPVGENPFAITINPEGTRVYVTNFLDHTVSVINSGRYSPGFNTVDETIEVGLNPIDALVTPDGDRLIVSNLGSMDLSIVDSDRSSATYNMVLHTVGTGQTTRTMTVTPDGGLLYIGTNDGYLVVSVVDFGVVKQVGTGSTTKAITVTPDGALLIVLTAAGEVMFIDIAEGSPTEDQVVHRVGTGSTVKSVTVTPDGGLLYLVMEAIDAILTGQIDILTSASATSGVDSPVDLVEVTFIDTFYTGEDPYEIVFAPGGSNIAVITNAGDNTMSIYNPGGMPIGIAITGFEAKQSREAALLEWRTHLEERTSGFHILRSEYALFGYERVTAEPVPAKGMPSEYTFRDESVQPGKKYYYKIQAVGDLGSSEEFGPVEFMYTPRFTMYQNVPNPFNPVTKISFVIPETGHVDLRVYDVTGRLIRTLVNGKLAADRYEVTWDGTNNGGRSVASGVYFYRIKAGKHEKTKKMVMLR